MESGRRAAGSPETKAPANSSPSRSRAAQAPRPPKQQRRPPAQRTQQVGAPKDKFSHGGFTDADIYPGIPKPKSEPPDPKKRPAFLCMIKTPGMCYATQEGNLFIHSAIIRALLEQRVSDERAREIFLAMGGLEDSTTTTSASTFEEKVVGSLFFVTLQPSVFDKLEAIPEFKDY